MSGFFELFQRSAWRLEVQPFYGPDAEEFGRYQHGRGPNEAHRRQRQRWLAHIAEVKAAGGYVGRVLVVRLPLSPYWRWRLETARAHVQAGEDIRVAVVDYAPALAALDQDFWLLDDRVALLMEYDADGLPLGKTLPTRDPQALRICRQQRDLAMAASVPLAEFLQPA